MRHSLLKIIITSSVSLLLSACMMGPNFHKPAAPKTKKYTSKPLYKKTSSSPVAGSAGNAQYISITKTIPKYWWRLFHSHEMNAFINEGLRNSPTLAQATASLAQAKQALNAQIGTLLFPQIDLGGSGERLKTNGVSVGINQASSTFNLFNTSMQVNYILDFFGKQRRQIEQYAAQVDYVSYQVTGVYLTLTSNIATTAIASSALDAQIKTTKALIKADRKILEIVKKQKRLGGVSYGDVLTQQTQLLQTEAKLPPLEKALAESQHTLMVLLGRLTSSKSPPIIPLSKLHLPKHLPLLLPSSLVQQRPDIKGSEALLHAASAEIGVTTANFFPQITLTGAYGWLATTPSKLFDITSSVWNFGGQLLQPIFHGGALIAEHKASLEAYKASYASYKQTVLEAFKNVSDVLRAIQTDANEFKAQSLAADAARKTLVLTKQQFELGGQDYLKVLNAEEKYQVIVIDKIKAQTARYSDTVALFQALGGGWWQPKKVVRSK